SYLLFSSHLISAPCTDFTTYIFCTITLLFALSITHTHTSTRSLSCTTHPHKHKNIIYLFCTRSLFTFLLAPTLSKSLHSVQFLYLDTLCVNMFSLCVCICDLCMYVGEVRS